MKKLLVFLSLLFVLFSLLPTFYEIQQSKYIPKDREFVLEHNYMFDYNFYLSRILQGIPARNASRSEAGGEGRWNVIETYYNQPHAGSLFQILYLYAGKIGGIFGLSAPVIYHSLRFLTGIMLLMIISRYCIFIFSGWWPVVAFLFVVTAGSWPILVKVGEGYRFATHMGWWSVMDSLQRITTIPHILFGQIFLILFLWRFSTSYRELTTRFIAIRLLFWGIMGLIVGIIFPPTLVIVYPALILLSFLEITKLPKDSRQRNEFLTQWLKVKIIPRIIFITISIPSFLYLQKMFQILPWSALALFDVQHRISLPYMEFILALGPVLPLGLAGLLLVLFTNQQKLFPMVSWVIAIVLLILMFEKVPQQSPLRFTEGLITMPLGILATYFLYRLWHIHNIYKRSLIYVIRGVIGVIITIIIVMGLSVMGSIVLWLTDGVNARRAGTWLVPTGAQIAYPLKDFMDGIRFLKVNTKHENVVLSYETAGNFIGAYAGNFVYIGHANTPDADKKLPIAKDFFSGKMSQEQAKEFLQKERVSYIFFGPQEREVGGISDLIAFYPGLKIIYQNPRVIIYQITNNR